MSACVSFRLTHPASPLERVESELGPPPPGHVKIKIHACGICHGDVIAYYGLMGTTYPRVPGHEIAGVVEAVGEGVSKWKEGDRVAVGWFGGSCHSCDSCAEGDLILCDNGTITGATIDGGYQQYTFAKSDSLAAIPDSLTFQEAAPLVCAGVTVFNSLRRVGALHGATVAVNAIGGLGHLGIQYASKMGYRVFAFSRGRAKEELARKLGAHEYFDTTEEGFVEKVKALGGVDVILETSTSTDAANLVLPCLAKKGTFVILGVGRGAIQVDPAFMIGGRRKVLGFPSGCAADSVDALKFAALHGVRSVNEVYPLSKTPEAFQRMMSGESRFRVVLDCTSTA